MTTQKKTIDERIREILEGMDDTDNKIIKDRVRALRQRLDKPVITKEVNTIKAKIKAQENIINYLTTALKSAKQEKESLEERLETLEYLYN